MTAQTTSRTIKPRRHQPGGVILIEIDSRQAWSGPARSSVLAMARNAHARLILFDRATASRFTDPYPSGPWTADVDGPNGDRPVTSSELDIMGRDALSRIVARANRQGVPTEAWLARGTRRRALREAARRTAADVVVLREERAPSLVERLLGNGPIDRRTLGAAQVVVAP